MRYEIREMLRPKYCVMDPGKLCWKIWDNKKEQYGLSYYLSETAAQKILEGKQNVPNAA